MAYMNDQIFVQGLSWATANGTVLRLCTQEPTTYVEAATTYGIANNAVALPAPVNGAIDGMRVIIPIVIGGAVTATGTATYWALTDSAAILVAAGLLDTAASLVINTLFDFTRTTDITLRDAV
jgi:hypothetical protein